MDLIESGTVLGLAMNVAGAIIIVFTASRVPVDDHDGLIESKLWPWGIAYRLGFSLLVVGFLCQVAAVAWAPLR